MPKRAFDPKAENKVFTLLPNGDYPFEITAINTSISTGSKTAGSDQIQLTVGLFKDGTFAEQLSQCREMLIFHASCGWKIDVFAKSANMLIDGRAPGDGEELDYSEDTLIGLRGWCTVGQRDNGKQGAEKKVYNEIKVWITNRPKLTRNTPAPKHDPFAAPPSEKHDPTASPEDF